MGGLVGYIEMEDTRDFTQDLSAILLIILRSYHFVCWNVDICVSIYHFLAYVCAEMWDHLYIYLHMFVCYIYLHMFVCVNGIYASVPFYDHESLSIVLGLKWMLLIYPFYKYLYCRGQKSTLETWQLGRKQKLLLRMHWMSLGSHGRLIFFFITFSQFKCKVSLGFYFKIVVICELPYWTAIWNCQAKSCYHFVLNQFWWCRMIS